MKILIIRFSSLGDILLTTPIIRTLRNRFPSDSIDYLTKKQFIPLLENNPNINKIIEYDNLSESIFELAKRVQIENYDLIIDLHSKLNTFIIKLYSWKSKKATYSKKHFYRWLLTKKYFTDYADPIDSTVRLYASALNKIGVQLDSEKLDLFLPENKKAIYNSFKIPESILLAVIAPGAKHYTKQYPPEYYSRLIDMITNEFACTIVLIGNESEKKLAEKVTLESQHEVINLCGKTNLVDISVIIHKADIFISGDTGPMHIAAALGKPQIAIFGGTHPKLGFGPLNPEAIVLQRDLRCSPCSLHGLEKCPNDHFKCMLELKPEEVFLYTKKLMNILNTDIGGGDL